MNRRDFLVATTVSAAAFSIARTLGADASARRPIRVGFFGASHSHAMDKLSVVRASKDYELIGVFDESSTVGASCEKLGVKLLSRLELLLQADVVVIESAVRDHGRDALSALRSGKHVHVEKPPATTLTEFQQILALAGEKKLVFQNGYMWRYHPGFELVFEAARKGWLGEIYLIRAMINNNLAPARRPQWAEFKGGSMFDLGSHFIDAAVRLLGKPNRVTPFLRHDSSNTDSLKDNNLAVLEYDKAMAVITNSALQTTEQPERSFEVLGSKGSALLRPIEPPGLQVDFVNAVGPYAKGAQTISLPGYKRFEADFVELAAAVRGERPLSVTAEHELAVQETLLKACAML